MSKIKEWQAGDNNTQIAIDKDQLERIIKISTKDGTFLEIRYNFYKFVH